MDTTRTLRALVALLLLTFLAACATMPPQREDATFYPSQSSRALITAQQLRSADATSFADALRRLRPLLFSKPVAFAISDPYGGYPVLYLDGRLQGALDLLSTIPLSVVRSVQVLSGVEGHAYFGHYHPGGVVEVNTAKDVL